MGLMKKLTSAIVASSLVLGLVGTAAADYSPAGVNEAAARMKALGVVKGVETPTGPDLMLNKPITRAELVTIIVRAFGKEDLAKLLKGSPSFSDSAEHWASGEIAMAKNIIESKGHTLGVTPTTFVPNKEVSSAEAIAFVMKFLGVKENTTLSWPMNFIQGAVDAGLITEADKATLSVAPNSPAIRGLVFYLADHAFHTYKMADTGKTAYTSYLDTTAPTLSVDAAAATTEAKSVTVTGKVSGHQVLHVSTTAGDTSAAVEADLDGTWSATLDLKVGANEIWVHAVDIAGNVATSSATVTRVAGAAAKVEATLSTTSIAAGGTADLAVVVKDANNIEIASPEFTVTVEGNIGTYADGVFTAADTTGTGKLTITAGEATTSVDVTVVAGALATVEASKTTVAPGEKVTLTAKDAKGNVITSGVSYTQTSADALVDSTNGSFIASKAGNYTVTAKADGVEKTVSIGVYSTTVAKHKVTASADSIITNNASTIELTIQAVDANGNVVGTEGTTTAPVQSSSFEYLSDATAGTWTSLATAQTITLTNGVATIKVRALSTELGGKVAQIKAGTSGTTETTTSVTLVDQVATSIAVTNSDTFLPSNSTNPTTNKSVFTVTVNDQAGKKMLTGYYPVTVNLSANSGATINAVSNGAITSGTNGTAATVYYNAGTAPTVDLVPTAVAASGTATLSASGTGLTGGSDAVTVQMPGPAAKLVLTSNSNNPAVAKANYSANTTATAMKYTVQVTDAAGVKVAAPGGTTVQVEFPNLTSTTWGEVFVKDNKAGSPAFAALTAKTLTLNVDGTGLADFEIRTNKMVGDLAFQVKEANGTLAAPASATASFKADDPSLLAFTVNGTANKSTVDVAAANTALTVVGQLYDAAGNKATYSGAKIKLVGAASAGGALASDIKINGVDNDESVVVDANGSATFEVAFGGYVGASYTLTASGIYRASGASSDTTITTALASNVRQTTVSVQNTVAANVSLALFSDSARTTPVSTVNANDAVYVKATVTDANGRPVNGETLVVEYRKADGTYAAVSGVTVSAGTDAGTYLFSVNPQTAPALTYRVKTSNGAAASSAEFSVGVRALTTPSKLVIAGGNQDIVRNTVTAFTVNVADLYGNTIVNNTGSAYSVTVTLGGIPSGKLAQVRSSADGLAISAQSGTSATATLSVPAGAQSVTFYVVTDAAAAASLTLDATATGLTAATQATLTVK